MQKLLRKVFGIYPGEGIHNLRFVIFAVLWAFSSTSLETLTDGLLLEHVGAPALKLVYLLGASILIIASSLIVYSLRIISPYFVLMTVMTLGLTFATLSVGILALSATIPIWFWYAFKIFTMLFFYVFLACSWTFIDQYHDLRDAKRIYSLYSAAFFLGIVFSGLFLNISLDAIGLIPTNLIVIGALLAAIWTAREITRKVPAIHDDTMEGVFSGDRHGFSSMLKMIAKSPYTIALLALSLGHQCLLILTEYNYMQGFELAFQNKVIGEAYTANNVAELLGKYKSWIAMFNIFLGAFIYPPFLRRVGLSNAIIIAPVFFLFVYSGWLVNEGFWISLMGLFVVDGISYTIEDNNFNLLTKAVPPKLKSKVRIINDSFFEPLGMLLCALMLFVMKDHGLIIGFIFSIITFLLVFILRAYYSKAIFTSLKEQAVHFERKAREWFKQMGKKEHKETKKDIIDALSQENEKIKIMACRSLLALEDNNVLDQILSAAKNISSKSKIELIHLFEKSQFANNPRIIELVDLWLSEAQDPDLSKTAHFFLAKKGLLHPEKVLDDLDSDDLILRGAAIITLNKSQAAQNLDSLSLYKTIALKETDLMLKSSDPSEICMGLEILREAMGSYSAEKALPFLLHEENKVKRSAATTLSVLVEKSHSRFSSNLIQALKESFDQEVRKGCLMALGNINNSTTVKEILLSSIHFRPMERRLTEEIIIAMGLKTVPTLLACVKDSSLHDRSRILAGKILATLAPPQLQANLHEIVDVELERAFFYFYYGHTIQKRYPLYDLSSLEEALLTSSKSVIDFIIYLLGAAGSIEDSELLVHSIRSKNEKMYGNALETLERSCDNHIYQIILPLIDDIPIEEKLYAAEKILQNSSELSLSELLDQLGKSPALFDKVVAVKLQAALNMPNWRASLKEQITQGDETFHHYAYELLEL